MEGGEAREGRERGEALSRGRAGGTMHLLGRAGRSLMEQLREQGESASPPQNQGTEEV